MAQNLCDFVSLPWKLNNPYYYNIATTVTLLVFSILWSFKSSVLTSIKIKIGAKNFLPLVSKLILGVRYFIIFLTRIGCIVSYYSPHLGLVGIMNHFHAERFPLDKKTFDRLNKQGNLLKGIDNKFHKTI